MNREMIAKELVNIAKSIMADDITGVFNVLHDGFNVDKNVAEHYADKILKSNRSYKKVKSIISDIVKDSEIDKAMNMIMDELA